MGDDFFSREIVFENSAFSVLKVAGTKDDLAWRLETPFRSPNHSVVYFDTNIAAALACEFGGEVSTAIIGILNEISED